MLINEEKINCIDDIRIQLKSMDETKTKSWAIIQI